MDQRTVGNPETIQKRRYGEFGGAVQYGQTAAVSGRSEFEGQEKENPFRQN